MPNEYQGFSYGPEPEIAAPSQTRFQRALDAVRDPVLQETAKRFGKGVGTAAVHGALENAGLVKYDDEGTASVRKRGVVRAVLSPRRTVTKVTSGAVKGVRGHVKEQAVGIASQKVGEMYGGRQPVSLEQAATPASFSVPESSNPGSWELPTNNANTGQYDPFAVAERPVAEPSSNPGSWEL
jgi:hypothetical protein